MTAVKFCGFRHSEDVECAVRAGADLIGLNFVPSSPRFVSSDVAEQIIQAHGSSTLFVGVFMDASSEDVQVVLDQISLNFVQFHGEEVAEFCESFDRPYIKAVNVNESFDFDRVCGEHPNAFAFMLDAPTPKGGGSGRRFDWTRFPTGSDRKVFLAGGLNPENVADAIEATRPWAVDVASGIEDQDRRKSRTKMIRFMQGVRSVPA